MDDSRSKELERRWNLVLSAVEHGDFSGAEYMLKSLGKEGYIAAYSELGVLYESGGKGFQPNLPKSIEYYTIADEAGELEGMLAIARLKLGGAGLSKDYLGARKRYELILGQVENRRALFGLGWIYEHGLAVNEDNGAAIDYYLRAHKAGHLFAGRQLSALYCREGKWLKAGLFRVCSIVSAFYVATFDRKNLSLYRQL